MTNSFIELIFDNIANSTMDQNPIYSPEVRDQSQKMLKKYSTKETYLDLDEDLGALAVLIEHTAFVAGFKAAMKLQAESAF